LAAEYNCGVNTDPKAQPIVIRPERIVANLSPDAFHLWAEHFLKAARDFRAPGRFSPVPLFLICQAIELELKSRHLVNSTQQCVKRRYRHNLLRAYNALDPSAKTLSPDEVKVLRSASRLYGPLKRFQYWNPADALTGYSKFPDVEQLEAIAAKLVDSQPPT
jgi:hypothetical protein